MIRLLHMKNKVLLSILFFALILGSNYMNASAVLAAEGVGGTFLTAIVLNPLDQFAAFGRLLMDGFNNLYAVYIYQDGGGYSQSSYYGQGNYYSQGSYTYIQAEYFNYAQDVYYSQQNYYTQAAYIPPPPYTQATYGVPYAQAQYVSPPYTQALYSSQCPEGYIGNPAVGCIEWPPYTQSLYSTGSCPNGYVGAPNYGIGCQYVQASYGVYTQAQYVYTQSSYYNQSAYYSQSQYYVQSQYQAGY